MKTPTCTRRNTSRRTTKQQHSCKPRLAHYTSSKGRLQRQKSSTPRIFKRQRHVRSEETNTHTRKSKQIGPAKLERCYPLSLPKHGSHLSFNAAVTMEVSTKVTSRQHAGVPECQARYPVRGLLLQQSLGVEKHTSRYRRSTGGGAP